jgi:NAD-dependent deacetylase
MVEPPATDLVNLLSRWRGGSGLLVFLTGAGVSAESGIPTFRGKDGYWRVGSENYSPMDLATHAMFERAPEVVWCWYLSRFRRAASAEPNDAHRAIAQVQKAYGPRVGLITQNVDGLHQRAGSPPESSYAIHGSALFIRCAKACSDPVAMPALSGPIADEELSGEMRLVLTCTRCRGWMRPHVLWFDEYYNELYYRSESALAAAEKAALLVTAGSTGATTLPMTIARASARRGVPIIDVNVERNPFSDLADECGLSLREPASVALVKIAHILEVETAKATPLVVDSGF